MLPNTTIVQLSCVRTRLETEVRNSYVTDLVSGVFENKMQEKKEENEVLSVSLVVNL